MSMPSDPHNPYASPLAKPASAAWPNRNAPPTFAKVMFIIDLVLCAIRALLVLAAVPGYIVLKQQQSPLAATAIPEILCGLAIVLSGIPADILGLLRKPSAVWFGAFACLAALASVAVGAWQASFQLDNFAAGTPQRVGFYLGLGFTLLVRIGIVVVYAAALVQFANWCKRALPGAR